MQSPRKTSVEKVRRHRARLRQQGLRPVQIRVADTRTPGFAEEARRQSLVIAASTHTDNDQAFIDSISEFDEE